MVANIVYTDESKLQVHRAKCYFDFIDKGEEFLNDFEKTVELIRRMPEGFQIRYRSVRILNFAEFNYSIHYKYVNHSKFIYNVFNQSELY